MTADATSDIERPSRLQVCNSFQKQRRRLDHPMLAAAIALVPIRHDARPRTNYQSAHPPKSESPGQEIIWKPPVGYFYRGILSQKRVRLYQFPNVPTRPF